MALTVMHKNAQDVSQHIGCFNDGWFISEDIKSQTCQYC